VSELARCVRGGAWEGGDARNLRNRANCPRRRPGYQEASYLNHSGTSATIAANIAVDILLTAGISSIIDSANGADNKYYSVVNVSLAPNTAAGNEAPAKPVADADAKPKQ
jgi:hypothetical protein